ncbi:hypothetical protein EJA72_27325 [Pseudomonas sp. PB120]|uniref:hypothetical protein n=1 Tax=Pseudomonas sp. PB120 TaxID=2494700 RepID=UPI0012FE454D|nr:hypothetical protein [Pseudomonas sp. PB120]MVV51923.1 hypothetical protein [Pseudomonas sp. PB120]
MFIYLTDNTGVLNGPVELPVIPGIGTQMPANAVELEVELAAPEDGHVWVLGDAQPEQIADHRGTVYRTDNGAALQYFELGDLPEGLTAKPKPSAAYQWWQGEWVQDLTSLHALQAAKVNAGCVATITGGFWSSALGSPHQYSSEMDDQLNLTGAVLRGLEMLYACRDQQGVKAFRSHTVAQLRQVSDDFTDYKLLMLLEANRLKQLLDQALLAGDPAAIEVVIWKEPQP